MRALVKDDDTPGEVALREVPEAEPGPGEVKISLLYAGICQTDLAMVDGLLGPPQGYHPDYPVILGHEFVGRVHSLGRGVTGLRIGDRVVGSGHLTCGDCRWCRAGRSMLCVERRTIGIDSDGVFAERFCLPADNLATVDQDTPDRLAALAEPFAVSARAVDVAAIEPGDRVAVIGPGSVGQLTVGALADSEVTVIGRPADRDQLERCRTFGAAATLAREDEIAALFGCFDVVIETAGSGRAVGTGVELLAPGGRLVCVGVPHDSTTFASADLVLRERSIRGTRSYDRSTWATIPGRLRRAPGLEAIVSHVLTFDEFERGRQLVATRAASKVLMTP